MFAVTAGLAREVDNLTGSVGEGVGRLRDYLVNGPMSVSPQLLDEVGQEFSERVRARGRDSLSGATVILEAFGSALLALVLLFFLLKDGPAMWRWAVERMPQRQRDRADAAGRAGWTTLKAYVRGVAIIAAIDAAGIGIGLVLLDVPLALQLTLLTFVACFIPILGATLAGAVAVLVALAANGPVNALLVLGVVLLVQNVEGNLLEPLIMGRAVRLHPAVVLVAVAAGALLAGIGGAMLATPITAVAYRMVRTFREDRAPSPAVESGP